MRISPIISFSVNLIIYAIFDEDLSQDLSARIPARQEMQAIAVVDEIKQLQNTFNRI